MRLPKVPKLTVRGIMLVVAVFALLLGLIRIHRPRGEPEAVRLATEYAKAVVVIDHPFSDFTINVFRSGKNPTGWAVDFQNGKLHILTFIPDPYYEYVGWKCLVRTNYPVVGTEARRKLQHIDVEKEVETLPLPSGAR
jgi:hypothetical protein